MLNVGDHAPAFSGLTTGGHVVSDRSLRGKLAVLYFFPRAFTSACTIETRGFRDNYDELTELGAEVVGISTDSLERQCRFATSNDAKFPMIGDDERKISKAFKVLWPLLPLARRVTFVLDENGIILATFAHEFQVNRHLDGVMQFVRQHRTGTKGTIRPLRNP